MAQQNRARWKFQADRGGKKAESGRCHVTAEGDRCQRTLPVNLKPHGDRLIEMGLIQDVRVS